MIRLSVVVTIVDGGAALDRVLAALANQTDGPPMEVLVPWDDTVTGIGPLAAAYPGFRFLALGTPASRRPVASTAGQHELFDRRRSAGLAAATGELVAILEDRGVPRPAWARSLSEAHRHRPDAAIGGAIENGREQSWNWAVYFCDFGRYQLPFASGPREYVSDINVCYKRRALEQTRALWSERYHETTVHWALQRAGETLYLAASVVVDQLRDDLALASLMRERVGWGRLFAHTRAREIGSARRLLLAALTPALPLVLFVRLCRDRLVRRRSVMAFVRVTPRILLLLAAWSAGELVGYLFGEP